MTVAQASTPVTFPVGGLATISQACQFLSVSRSRLFELLKAGEIPSTKIQRSRRMKWRDLYEYVDGLKYATPGR